MRTRPVTSPGSGAFLFSHCTAVATLPGLRPIRVYLLILVLGAMLPGGVLTGVLVWRAITSNRAVSERRLLESARVDASALDREFDRSISILHALATSPTLDATNLEAFYLEGRRVQATQPGWDTITLLSLEGAVLVSTKVPWGTSLLRTIEPVSLHHVIATKAPSVGVIRPGLAGDPEHLFPIRVPVIRQNVLKYVLSALVNVESVARLIPRQMPNSEEWTRTVLDSDGAIALRTRGAEHYIGTHASEPFLAQIRQVGESMWSSTTREGQPVYAAFARSAYGWTAVVVVPRGVLDAPLRGSMGGVVIGGALLMISGLLVALLISRRLSADFAAATSVAEAVAAGRSAPRRRMHVAETERLQQALVTAASLLEKRARERDDEIARADSARRDAEEANQTKDQFLAVLGHELRNPLAPALTALELMKARNPDTFKREREVLERQVAHMSRLVNDLLDVSRLARGKVQLDRRRFELKEAVDRAVDMARPLIVRHLHTIDVSVPVSGLMLDADLDRIVQVLSNLLTNAAKYSTSAGHISLTAAVSGDRVIIMCEDDGPGIPADLAPQLFDTFAQGPRSLDRREGGLGLGLALARTFTELHGGTIRYETRVPEGGSRFIITLPLALASSGSIARFEPTATLAGTQMERVLVVDDNADAREMLSSALASVGHIVAMAENGPDALEMVDEFRPSVGVLDIGLPQMNGYELATRLRSLRPDMRLIALTGYGRASDIEAAAAAGFDAHCAKPIAVATLLEEIQKLRTV
jgi:signal transduction histidine kinase/CheY-like chemotaxis protein